MMAVVALLCAGAGSFEIHRLQEKRHDNGVLIANAHAPVTPLTAALVPLSGPGALPSAADILYRTVSASGQYVQHADQFVDDQNQGGHQGFDVLTPLRTSGGTLLVVRGFVASTSSGARPSGVAAAPTGTVRVVGRMHPAQTSDDRLGRLGDAEITSVNPRQQSARLSAPVFAGYLELAAGAPGNTGLDAVPAPDLSNPTGGAGELQLLSYVLQWYVFALLALAVPFLFSRNEVREARKRFLGYDPDDVEFDLAQGERALELEGAAARSDSSALPVARDGGTVATVDGAGSPECQKAAALADRYGRSLGSTARAGSARPRRAPAARERLDGVSAAAYDSSVAPHRSGDEYHASYNDYLWQLAMADGDLPGVEVQSAADDEDAAPAVTSEPRVIDSASDGEGDAAPQDRAGSDRRDR